MEQDEYFEEMDILWNDAPAYMLDWFRENKDKIKKHLVDVNRFIDEMIDIVK